MSKRLTNLIFDRRIKNRKIKRIDNYTHIKEKIKFNCLICDNVWNTSPDKILVGCGCPRCADKNRNKNSKLTNNIIDQRIKDRPLKRLDKYIDSITKIKFKCLTCDNTWPAAPNKIISGGGCPKCVGNIKLTNITFDDKIKDRYIKRLDRYINTNTKIRFKCLTCDNIWKSKPTHIICGSGCPKCSLSKNELKVRNFIKKYINFNKFKPHKKVIINKRRFYPDYYLEINKRIVIIEYNGAQHYRPVRFGGMPLKKAKLAYHKQKLRDRRLRKYCKSNNITLLEIPFWWKDDIIIQKLKEIK